VLTVDRVSAAFVNLAAVDGAVQVELDDGSYQTITGAITTTPTTITLPAGLTAAASAGRHVYPLFGYAERPILDNVVISGTFDGVFLDYAAWLQSDRLTVLDYENDGVHLLGGPGPDSAGNDHFHNLFLWDFSVGTSNAGIELHAGSGSVEAAAINGSLYSVLLNQFFGPTGTLLLSGGGYENSIGPAIKLHQSVASAILYGNVIATGIEIQPSATGQALVADDGGGWLKNLKFTNNIFEAGTTGGDTISIQDGIGVTIADNILRNDGGVGPHGISVGGSALNVSESGNIITNYPSGSYGTMNAGSLAVPKVKRRRRQLHADQRVAPDRRQRQRDAVQLRDIAP
jgi:hypothetical protein